MGTVRPLLNVAINQRSKIEESAEALHWQNAFKVGKGHILKEFSPVNHVDIRDNEDQFLVCSGSRLVLYPTFGSDAIKTYSAPKTRQLYHAVFRRPDQKVLAAGSDTGCLFVWDANASRPLRIISDKDSKKSAKQASDSDLNAIRFVTFFNGGRELVTGSDDGIIRLWDLAAGTLTQTLGKHTDYVRSGTECLESRLVATGGYDHVIQLWDCRTTDPVHRWSLKAPIESLHCNRHLLYAASAHSLYSYDLVAGRMVAEAREVHSKQVTAVVAHGKSVISVGLEGQLRVWDHNLRPLYRASFAPSQLTSVALNSKHVAIGSSDGQVHIKPITSTSSSSSSPTSLLTSKSGTDEMTDKNQSIKVSMKSKRGRKTVNPELTGIDVYNSTLIVRRDTNRPTHGLKAYERLLLEFRFSDALDAVMLQSRLEPSIVVSMLQELIRRHGLHIALAGRPDVQVKRIIMFICRHITGNRLSRPLLDTSMALTELYTAQAAISTPLANAFKRLHTLICNEISRLEQISCLQGQLDLIISNLAP